jgi:hypothetical protein
MRTFLAVAAIGLFSTLATLQAADWPGWRGPEGTGISKETGLLKVWPKEGPKLVWQSDKAGQGYAGMAVVGGTVYTMGARGDDEYVLALNGEGKQTWATKLGPLFYFKENSWSHGPNCTPTVRGDLVFALTSKGVLGCLKKADGSLVWKLDLPKDLDGDVDNVAGFVEKFGWGYCWSPLVDGDRVVITPGGPKGLVASVDMHKGKVVWRSKGIPDTATYSTPTIATLGGVKQYVCTVQTGAVGVAASDGALLWRWKRDEKYSDVVCPTPIVHGDRVYVSVGEGGQSQGLKITATGGKFTVEPTFTEPAIGNKQGGVVRIGKYVYGYHEKRNWACQDFESGELVWPKKRGKQTLKEGGFVVADARMYVLDEEGMVGMLEASPKGYKEVSKFALPAKPEKRPSAGKVWAHPSLSDGKLYVRDQELVFCYQVK